MRLCANCGAQLHLVGPMGFVLDDGRLKRAGLDYRDMARVSQYTSWSDWLDTHPEMPLWAFSTKGKKIYTEARFKPGDGLLFGPETRGLPVELLEQLGEKRVLRLPMLGDSRSMNLSNTVAVGLFEGLRQLEFPGLG